MLKPRIAKLKKDTQLKIKRYVNFQEQYIGEVGDKSPTYFLFLKRMEKQYRKTLSTVNKLGSN